MLDENLPTFFTKQPSTSDGSLSTVIYFTQNGSEPTPEYSYRRPDPTLPQARNKFALGLADARNPDVVFGEVVVEPEWQQPTLSAAEHRAQNGVPPQPVPLIPDGFSIQLYNPDQQITVKAEKSTWTGKESWEFEMPVQSFKMPSASKLDQQKADPTGDILTPKVMFRWKRDSKFSKDMTCYMTGTALGKQKNKDPDITVALFKQGRNPGLTIYEPNLNRVDVEDRKGLEVALLLGAETIREIYLFPSRESFNMNGAAPPNKRKNSRPIPAGRGSPPAASSPVTTSDPYAMSGGLGNLQPARTTSPTTHAPPASARQASIDAETKRLKDIMDKEERERAQREREEENRVKMMLEQEDKERQAEVARETERLRREFGMEGQDYERNRPALPPRQHGGTSYLQAGPSAPPQRPVSVGPQSALSSWWHGPAMGPGTPPPAQYYQPQAQPKPSSGRRRGGSDGSNKIKKKRSVFF